MDENDGNRVAFVCVRNAGRSQMASAFARRERANRGFDDVDVLAGGTEPADGVHDAVVRAMDEVGVDLSERTPREITAAELQEADYVVAMGCSASDVCPATWTGENHDWGLNDPGEADVEAVRAIRDEIEARVSALFDELERDRSAE